MPSDSVLKDFFADLRHRVNSDVRTDAYSRIFYSTDASIYQVKPFGVLLPEHMEDVHAAVELARKYTIPIVPRTGGSSLAGQAVNEALVIDFSKFLNSVLEVNKEEQWVRVQPGIVLDVLNNHLKSYEMKFGPDPASANRAAMGGIVANNSTGSHSILYGMTADHVLETRVFLSDGSDVLLKEQNPAALKTKQNLSGLEGQLYRQIAALTSDNQQIIRKGTPRHWRRCGGYNLDRFVDGPSFNYPQPQGFNLARLICGSEGTLAVMNEIKLNIVEQPGKSALAIVHFNSLYEALSTTPAILEVNPSAVELLDNYAIEQCLQLPAYSRMLNSFMKGKPNCLLITEFYGEKESELKAKIEELEDHLKKNKVGAAVVPVLDKEHQQTVWDLRKVGLGLLMSIKGDFKPIPFIEDAAVPPQYLADYVTRIEKFCNDLGTKVAYYAHASAGCIHIRPLINAKMAADVEKLPQITQFSVELLGQYGGSFSSEHGDGRARSWLNEQFFGKELYALYKQTKDIFDADNIFNPGMVVNGLDMRKNLRYGSQYKALEIETAYDFSDDQGFHRAVEMCNGAGICRKTTGGTMCPSFMVTQEEEHSTRGRANALRAALSGKLDINALTSKRMFEVMDLCIECKGCKAECPSMVDMAKIKFEFLVQYYKKNRMPLRTRLFASMPDVGKRIHGYKASFFNQINTLSPVKFFMDAFLGISKQRELPAFAKESFREWHEKNKVITDNSEQPKVVLFVDTFNNFNQPSVLKAAYELLQAAGFEVIIPEPFCCGRPAISKGLFKKAQSSAQKTVEVLAEYVNQKIPIVGFEPSCLLTLREENKTLLPDNIMVDRIAESSYLIEEFIMDLKEKGQLNLEFSAKEQKVLLHGHCHQKSLVGTKPVREMLSLPENYQVGEVDSGCCGMAGSFGYEKEHYNISMQMAERSLLPAIRKQDKGTLMAASGFSCRHQISHGTKSSAMHPVEILYDAMVKK